MAARRGLGKGLDSMIPKKKESKAENAEKDQNPAEESRVEKKGAEEEKKPDQMVKISLVEPNKDQPRKNFDEESMAKLAESIKAHGILQPLLVTNKGSYFEIIAGERRWRAAKLAGLKEVPVIVREFTEQEIMEISLIENVQREDLNPIELAKAYKTLVDEYHLTQDELAEHISKSRVSITNTLRLLKLDERVQEMIINEMITEGHAKALLGLEDAEKQVEIATKVFDSGLSVRDTEALVKKLLEGKEKKEVTKESSAEDAIYSDLEQKFTGIVGTKVQIQRKKNNKGKIEIEYYSKEELERIIDLFESIGT